MSRLRTRNHILSAVLRTATKPYAWAYRRTGGRIGSKGGDGTPVLLLTVLGRKTGKEHTVPVGYFEEDGAYFVVGSAGGAKAEPQWARNLTAARTARIQIGPRIVGVTVERLEPDEQAQIWRDVVVTRSPSYASLPRRAGRPVPVFRLTPQRRAR